MGLRALWSLGLNPKPSTLNPKPSTLNPFRGLSYRVSGIVAGISDGAPLGVSIPSELKSRYGLRVTELGVENLGF